MVELFERHVKTLGKHIKDALKEELNRSVVASFATTASINDIRQMQKEVYLMYVLFFCDLLIPVVVIVTGRIMWKHYPKKNKWFGRIQNNAFNEKYGYMEICE